MAQDHFDIERPRGVKIAIQGYDPRKEVEKLTKRFERRGEKNKLDLKRKKVQQQVASTKQQALEEVQLAKVNQMMEVASQPKTVDVKTETPGPGINLFMVD